MFNRFLPGEIYSPDVSEFLGVRPQPLELDRIHDDGDPPVAAGQEYRCITSLVDQSRERSTSLGDRDFSHLPILGGLVEKAVVRRVE